jgi:Ion channel
MATIGYGDYIPTTTLAQIQAVILAVIGVVLNSQLIMALTNYLKMKIS